MNDFRISRRTFVRILAGLFAFIPAAKSLNAMAADGQDSSFQSTHFSPGDPPEIIPHDQLEETLKARIANGEILEIKRSSIVIKDYRDYVLELVVTDESIVWKGKYNTGNHFDSFPHKIEIGDVVFARGIRNNDLFAVEMMFVNIVNKYITVDKLEVGKEYARIIYSDGSRKNRVVELLPDYLKYKDILPAVLNAKKQLPGTTIQIVGLPLENGTIVACNVLF